jgi:integrase
MAKQHHVSWHSSGRWCFSKQMPNGARRFFYADPRIPNSAMGRRKATEWMESVLADLEAEIVQGEDLTTDQLRLLYLSWAEAQLSKGLISRHTFDGHRKQLALLCRERVGGGAFGDLIAKDLTARNLAELSRHWEKKSRTTVRNRLASLMACLNWAAESRPDRPVDRLIPVNPVAGYELPRVDYQGDRCAPAEEIDAFVTWLRQRAAARPGPAGRFDRLTAQLVWFVAETGCRPAEACVVKWEYVDLERRVIILPPRRLSMI